jgi:large subunit ribosomal protein L30
MRLKITLVRSPIGYSQDQRRTVAALGLRKLHHSVLQEDTPAIRGMVRKVRHLVQVEETEAADEA